MGRNQPARSKRRAERRDKPAAQRSKGSGPSAERATGTAASRSQALSKRDSDPQIPFTLALRICLVVTIVVFGGLILMLLSKRWHSDLWPSIQDVNISPLLGAVGVALLVAVGMAAWLASRMAQSARPRLSKLGLSLALVGTVLFMLLRCYEYGELHADGLWRRSTGGAIHERADLNYLHDVHVRLNELYEGLEDRRVNQPNEFTEEDAQRLELVSNLRTDMVSWTEYEVGHWLEDLQLRRAVLEMVAHHIHPLARNQADVARATEQERRELERRRQWFDTLYDYCQGKSELLGREATPADQAVAGTDVSGAAQADASRAAATNVSRPESLAEFDRQVREKLDALGLSGWSYARSVIADTSNVAMAGERLQQIAARLDAMKARAVFLDQLEETVLGNPQADGLNRKHRWLRLPVCLPGGNAWAGSFFVLTGFHMLLLGAVALLLLLLLLLRLDSSRIVLWRSVAGWCYTASVLGLAIFVLFYVF